MSESEYFTPLQKGGSQNGHDRPLRIVRTGTTILTKKVVVMIEEGSRAGENVSQHEGGDDG